METKKSSLLHDRLLDGYLEAKISPQQRSDMGIFLRIWNVLDTVLSLALWRGRWAELRGRIGGNLQGYVRSSTRPRAQEPNAPAAHAISSCVPRPWWSPVVPEDGCIRTNLSTHLRELRQFYALTSAYQMRGQICVNVAVFWNN